MPPRRSGTIGETTKKPAQGAGTSRDGTTAAGEDATRSDTEDAGGTEISIDEPRDTTPSICLGTNLHTGGEVRWPLIVRGNPHLLVAIFPELGDIQGERIRRAIKDSFLELGWDDPPDDPSQLSDPAFSRFVEILRSEPKADRGLKTLLSRLEELDDYGFFQAAETPESLWESEQPVVLRIHSTQNDNLQKAFASLVFYGLYKDMFRRGTRERITHALVFDEAHRAARLQLIPTMAKECRKYGISLVLASQEARDFNISLFSAIANYLVLRLTEADAKSLVRNVASSDQERTLIDKIKQMDRFKALYFCEGRKKLSPVALQP